MNRTENKHYYGLDWIRVFACIGIVLMHMLENNSYELNGFIANTVIPSFTDFTFLFMTVSAFGMCVGYYDKVMEGKVNWANFYKKRYSKILPFFSIVVFIDIVFNHDFKSLIEAVPNLTLTRGLFPNDIGQIGVAWFLGVVFVFYMIFPFFCSLISSKKTAWISLVVTILLNYIVSTYYGIGRVNIVYSMMFFVIGGLVYLYRDFIEGKWFVFPAAVFSVTFYYLVGGVYTCLLVSVTFLMVAISLDVSKNNVISFFSDISLEVFLCHMVVFRALEKVHFNTIIGNGWLQYSVTSVFVLVGAACFALVSKKLFRIIRCKYEGSIDK